MLLGDNPGPIARGRAADRTAAPAGRARRAAVGAARAAAGHSAGRADARRRQRADRRRARRLLPADRADRDPAASRARRWRRCSPATTAIWSRGRSRRRSRSSPPAGPIAGGARRGAARGGGDRVSADHSTGVSRSVGRAGRLPKLREFREQQALLFTAAQDARRLAQIRYEGGATSYLEVLDADTRLFAAELGLAQAELQRADRRSSRSTARSAAAGRPERDKS